MGHPIYHLDLKAERCHLRVRLNDVPVAELTASGDQPEWFAPPLNPYLVGAGNRLALFVRPLEAPDDVAAKLPAGSFAQARVDATVRRFEEGMPVAPGTGPVVARVDVDAVLAARIDQARRDDVPLDVPQIVEGAFDNEAVSFAAELEAAPPLTDTDALRDYAIVLRDLARAGDVDGLMVELAPKVAAYSAAYADDPTEMAQSLRDALRDEYFARGVDTSFERDEVELVSSAGGRLWEICRPEGKPLLQTPADAYGSTIQMDVIVGLADGALRVVR